MALVKFGAGIVQASGSISGQTYARNRFGNYMRARTTPVNPKSDRQNVVRARLSLLSEHWNEQLTPAERTAWNSYASAVAMTNRLGESINLTGFNHFIRSNSLILLCGHAIVEAGPVIMALPNQDPLYAIAINGATNQITITYDDTLPWNTEDDAFLVTQLASPQNASRTFCGGPWRNANFLEGVDPGGLASPFGPAGIIPWTFQTGQRCWGRGRIVRADGRVSNFFTATSVLAT